MSAEESLLDRSARELLALFAAGTPEPGGGSASALAGSLAAALAAMVGKVTLRARAYEPFHGRAREIVPAAEELQAALQLDVDEDCRAFAAVMELHSAGRRAEAKAALGPATEVPLRVAHNSLAAGALALELCGGGHRAAQGDASAAAALAAAAAESALLTACANLKALRDEPWADELRCEAERSLDSLETLREGLRARLSESLRECGLVPTA